MSLVQRFDSEGNWTGWEEANSNDYQDWARQVKDKYGSDIPVPLIAEYDKYVDATHGPGIQGINSILSPIVQLGNQYGLNTDQLIQGIKNSGWALGSEGTGFTNGSNYAAGLDAFQKAAGLTGKNVDLNTPEIQKYRDQQSQAMYDRIDQSRKGDGGFWGFLSSTLSDPMFTLAAGGLAGIGLSGAAGFGGALAGEAGAVGVGETGAGTAGGWGSVADGLAAQEAGLSSADLAGWGGSSSGLGEGLGSLSGSLNSGGDLWSQLGVQPSDYLYGQSTTNPGLLNTLGVEGPYGGVSYAPWADAAAQGATAGQLASWVPQAGQSLSLFDTAKAAYDKYVKPLNQARSGISALTGGSGSSGQQYPMQGAAQEPNYGTAPTTYYSPVNYQNYGMGSGQLPNVGGTPQLPNVGGGLSGYFDYLPDYIKKGVINRYGQ